jgi:hypothetical protein
MCILGLTQIFMFRLAEPITHHINAKLATAGEDAVPQDLSGGLALGGDGRGTVYDHALQPAENLPAIQRNRTFASGQEELSAVVEGHQTRNPTGACAGGREYERMDGCDGAAAAQAPPGAAWPVLARAPAAGHCAAPDGTDPAGRPHAPPGCSAARSVGAGAHPSFPDDVDVDRFLGRIHQAPAGL